MIFNIVFFISVTSVLIQGTTLGVLAKWLKVALPEDDKVSYPTDAFLAENPKTAMTEIKVGEHCYAVDKKIVRLNFPKNAIIAMIKRDGSYVVPNGATVIEANDILIVLSDTQEGLDEVDVCLRSGDLV